MKTFPTERLVRRRLRRRGQGRAAGPHRLRPEDRDVPAQGRQRRRARRRLLAPPAAAVQGPAARRPDHLRLPRPGLQRRRPLHPHALAGDAQPRRLRARLPGGGEAPLRLGLARRPGAGRPGRDPRPALERRPGLGRRRQAHHREVRLPAGARQPDGPDARDLRARQQHRPAGRGRGALRRHARQPHGHRHALDGRHRSRRPSGPAS